MTAAAGKVCASTGAPSLWRAEAAPVLHLNPEVWLNRLSRTAIDGRYEGETMAPARHRGSSSSRSLADPFAGVDHLRPAQRPGAVARLGAFPQHPRIAAAQPLQPRADDAAPVCGQIAI